MESNREMPPLPVKPVAAEVKVDAVEMPPLPVHDEAPAVMPAAPVDEEAIEYVKVAVPRRIEVVAIRNGFFEKRRRAEGDVFHVPSMEKLGTWMKCTDPVLEKKHQVMMRERKESLKAAMLKK